jgi:anti-sigma B factor antagonist
MRIERTEEGNVTVVALEGVIRLGESAKAFSTYLEELLQEGAPTVLLDFTAIDHVDSTGLGELVGYLQRFTEQGRRLALLKPHRRILNLLKLTKLDEVFTIYDDLGAALAELRTA